jgi:hypothetical protein
MPNGKQDPDEIAIEWEYDKDYRIVAANGMWGGITPRGDLRIEFFVESNSIPREAVFLKDESGSYKERSKRPEKPAVVRKIQIGVMVPGPQVKSFAEWFRDKAQKVQISPQSSSKKVH